MVKEKQELLRRMAKSPLFMGRVVMPQMFSAPSCQMHLDMEREWMRGTRFANWIAPRGHAKTSVVGGVFPLHHLHFTPGPHVILLNSKTEGHAVRILDTMKDTMEYSHAYRAMFGYHGRHVAKKWTSSEVILDNGDVITTRGVNQQVVGLKYGHQRPTLIVCDDLEDLSNTKTEEAVATNRKWLMTQVFPALDPNRGRMWVVGTPQHRQGIVNHLHDLAQKDDPTWKSHLYTAILDEEERRVLWPEWMSWTRLQEMRQGMSPAYFAREYLCRISSDQTQLFTGDMIRFYNGSCDPNGDGTGWLKLDDKPPVFVYIFMGIDPAVSTSLRADYSVIMPIAVDSEHNRYILPYVRRRMPPSEVIDEIKRMYLYWKPITTSLETSGQQEIFRDMLTKVEGLFIEGLHKGYHPREAKDKRYIAALEPYFRRGKVFLHKSMRNLETELLEFTTDNRHDHDDQLDAMYYAFIKAYPPVYSPVGVDEDDRGNLALDWKLT